MDATETTLDELFVGSVADWSKSVTNTSQNEAGGTCKTDCGCEYGDGSECCTHRGIVPVNWFVAKTSKGNLGRT